MNKSRRIGAVIAAAVAAIGMTATIITAPAAAAPAGADPAAAARTGAASAGKASAAPAAIGMTAKKAKGPQPVSQLLPRVDDNSWAWVRVWFKTDRRACDFKLLVWDTNRVEVSYPNGWPYTSLSENATLGRGEVDYASFRIDVDDYTRDTWQLLYATMTWKWCGTNKVQTKSTGFLLPVENAS